MTTDEYDTLFESRAQIQEKMRAICLQDIANTIRMPCAVRANESPHGTTFDVVVRLPNALPRQIELTAVANGRVAAGDQQLLADLLGVQADSDSITKAATRLCLNVRRLHGHLAAVDSRFQEFSPGAIEPTEVSRSESISQGSLPPSSSLSRTG